jgi:hypothetical protein
MALLRSARLEKSVRLTRFRAKLASNNQAGNRFIGLRPRACQGSSREN